MSTTGAFASNFRTGESVNSTLELILNALNQAQGSAYTSDPGTAVYAQNFAFAKAIWDVFESNQRFINQSDPVRMSAFLSRWENILSLTPSATDTDLARRTAIGAKFKIMALPPTSQNVADLLSQLMGQVFVQLIHTGSASNTGTYPGGLTVPGGVSLPDGNFNSNIAYLAVRLWQPRDQNNNLLMSDQQFKTFASTFKAYLDDYLPAHMTYAWGRITFENTGTLTMTAGSTAMVGNTTTWITAGSYVMPAGSVVEVVDDLGALQTFTVATTTTNTAASATLAAPNAITARKYRLKGFYLDRINLDNALLT
jgi:hypothetical protein